MAVNPTTVRKRVTEILNACAPGTFSEAVDINYFDRNSNAILQAVTEAAMLVAKAIVMNPNHVHRGLFVSSTPTALTHNQEMPDMSAEPDVIQIKPTSTGSFQTGVSRDVQQIEAFRANPGNLYSAIAHDAADSPLGGYYAIHNGRFYFTGHAAQGFFPVIAASTVNNLIPDEYESTWVCLAVGLTVKEGDNLFPIAQYYYSMGMNDLTAVAGMSTVQPVPSPELAKQARGDS